MRKELFPIFEQAGIKHSIPQCSVKKVKPKYNMPNSNSVLSFFLTLPSIKIRLNTKQQAESLIVLCALNGIEVINSRYVLRFFNENV